MLKTILIFIFLPIFILGGIKKESVPTPEKVENIVMGELVVEPEKKVVIEKNNEISKNVEEKPVATKKMEVVEEQLPKTEISLQRPVPNFEEINIFARGATVNILCSTEGSELSPISGTGVIVDPRGIVLTNAHIGQYLLLKDFKKKDFVNCVIRTGSPAYPRYKIELMYISPVWVENNKTLLTQNEQKGTGERDFAFLKITSRIDNSPLENLNFVPINISEFVGVNEAVLLSSYPAGFLGGLSILQDLNVTTAITNVAEVYTYKENTIDLISVPGTVISQRGSSGGAVVDGNKSLLGIIVTSSDAKTTSERNLYAITGAYINRSLEDEINMNLEQFLSQDINFFIKTFQETTAPILTKVITDEILKKSN